MKGLFFWIFSFLKTFLMSWWWFSSAKGITFSLKYMRLYRFVMHKNKAEKMTSKQQKQENVRKNAVEGKASWVLLLINLCTDCTFPIYWLQWLYPPYEHNLTNALYLTYIICTHTVIYSYLHGWAWEQQSFHWRLNMLRDEVKVAVHQPLCPPLSACKCAFRIIFPREMGLKDQT